MRQYNNYRNDNRFPKSGEAYKTRICRYYAKGFCREGDRCQFAHGQDEQRKTPIDVPSNYKKPEVVQLPEDSLSLEERKKLDEKERVRLDKQKEFLNKFLDEVIDNDSRVSKSN
eukprot:TRINITY_DN11387_c0_g1_i1.p1 TRINITY_DN11387_c0_g1~~TRINITY_DN11387_c0_g1_i1.p1  ORF type:complete len:114 (+),score=31.43 TRINITY_DN11387_c0_g1_i1:56-397(+)